MDEKRLLERFSRYIACDSESGNEGAICLMLEEELQAMGLKVCRDEVGAQCDSNGWNVYAYLAGEGDPILFNAHVDTVGPGVGIRAVREGDRITSEGDTILGADDKAGIAAIMEAVQMMAEDTTASHRPVEVLFTVCEELGLLGSRHADYGRIKSKEGLVLDHGDVGAVVNRAPASVRIHIEVEGRSAHAGLNPENGRHALKAAAQAVDHIPCGRVDDETMMNVANFLSPGATNIVPERATFDMEIRSFREELLQQRIEETKKAIENACEQFSTTFSFTVTRYADALYVPEDSTLMNKLKEVYVAQNIPMIVESTFGGSDTVWLFSHGITALNIGVGMGECHSTKEYLSVSGLKKMTQLVLEMMK